MLFDMDNINKTPESVRTMLMKNARQKKSTIMVLSSVVLVMAVTLTTFLLFFAGSSEVKHINENNQGKESKLAESTLLIPSYKEIFFLVTEWMSTELKSNGNSFSVFGQLNGGYNFNGDGTMVGRSVVHSANAYPDAYASEKPSSYNARLRTNLFRQEWFKPGTVITFYFKADGVNLNEAAEKIRVGFQKGPDRKSVV